MNNDILSQLADNPALMSAVFAFIDAKFTEAKIDTGMLNEAIGQVVRANIEGRAKVADAFNDIMAHKTPPAAPEPTNPAR